MRGGSVLHDIIFIKMTDVHNKETRSYNMSRIKGKDTKPEIIVRRFLFSRGFRYRLHDKKLPGRPDIVMPKYKTIIFVHGCFWHGHDGCKYYVIPKTRTEWWTNKINTNKRNDALNSQRLTDSGWNIINIFECELRGEKRESSLEKLLKELDSTILSSS